ncbi:site-specific recombinase, phage integrase family [Streptococcus pneumoniae]|uniref:site-specific integrase n=1 Tax=Streptococcus pneumoniae TaxID=1313 RepID=UPI000E0BB139|nr:site-specific integrase [Streptococcus pneumoniae]VEE30035.1 site-specific recombinase, phage integrase family [Streptococcus pneumoniae]VFH47238.1 site-specific recombinase, phage integrase family [Streptococcus pneumoniae]VIP71409.1 site-specific recombinase, phage integrase family [Streptococcus pneumoniae]VIT81819.1 site-specific recombinase, phage integrase family [Streptococcus pneumoniae]VIX53236.1 site-specific recombinase, phage integrase family [Streptococcus pneumoniae]
MAIRKDKDNRWIVDISNGFDPITLKQRRIVRKGFKTKKEATEAEHYLRSVELKERFYGAKITVPMLYDMLKEEDSINHRKISYINTQENNYNKHIREYFINVDNVGKLTYEDIYQFREQLRQKIAQNTDKPLSTNTINKIMILLKKIFDVGLRKGYYSNNPVKLLKKLPIEKPKMQFWTIAEFQQFLKLFEGDEYNIKLLFTVLFFTGLRLGEALALTWQDIDFTSNTIHVTKSTYVNKGISHISTTKTKAGTRRIIINKKLSQELETWQKKQAKQLQQFSNDITTLQVFQNSPIIITKNAIEKQYKKILERDNTLKKIRIHDFRHSHASLLINNGEDYLVVKERLGHASITTTIDTYSHLYPSKQKDLADKLDELI